MRPAASIRALPAIVGLGLALAWLARAPQADAQAEENDETAEVGPEDDAGDEGEDDDGGFQLDDPWGDEDEDDSADDATVDEDEDDAEDTPRTPSADDPEDEDAGDADDTPPVELGGVTSYFGPADDGHERQPEDSTLIIPPLYLDRRGDTRTSAFFPLYFERSEPDDHQLLIGPYYRRRGVDVNADVVFPFYWSFRTPDSLTLAVPPFYVNDDADGFDWGIAPLVFDGRSGDSTYTVIPPLLTASWADDEEAYTFAGPFWRIRDREEVDWGVFPLVWGGRGGTHEHTVVAPFFFNFRDSEERTDLTIIPPLYSYATAEDRMWGFAGLLHHYDDADGTSWTVPPALFHYSRFGDDLRLVTPLFGYFDVEGESTLVTPLYQNHRGDTELDAVFPIFFSHRDPAQHSRALVIPPLVWHFGGPAHDTTIVFPFFGLWNEVGRYTTWATPLVAHYESATESTAGTWIFPTFQASHTPESTTFNIHPLVYSTSARTHRHFVLAPLYWDFEDYEDDSRATVAFPLFWRFRSGSTVSQLVGNSYYHYYREGGVPGWEFHFFPLFAFGVPRPGDHWWSVLYGLAGYKRQGRYARASALWIPFQVDGPDD